MESFRELTMLCKIPNKPLQVKNSIHQSISPIRRESVSSISEQQSTTNALWKKQNDATVLKVDRFGWTTVFESNVQLAE
jgi:hypothetical protein